MTQATRKLAKSSAPQASLWGRIILAVTLLGVMAFTAGLALTSAGLVAPDFLGSIGSRVYAFAPDLSGWPRIAFAAGSAVACILAALLLFRLSFKTEPRVLRHVLVADETGFVLVENDAVEAIAVAAAIREAGVVEAAVRVYSDSSGNTPVRLSVTVGVHPGAAIDAIGRGVRERCKDAVEQLVGLPVRNVTVSIYVMDADELIRVF